MEDHYHNKPAFVYFQNSPQYFITLYNICAFKYENEKR